MSAAGRRVRPRANRSDAAPAPRAAAIAPVGGDRVTTALIVALAAGVLLRVFAAALPGNALWGWDAWRDLPRAAAIGLACASVLAFVPAVGNAARRALEPAGRALDRGPWAPALLAAAFAALVLLARDDVRFVGDATFRLAAVSVRGDDARTLPQIGPLDRLLNVALPRVLDDALPMGPAGALQLAGALQALAFAAAAVAFVRALPAGTLARAGALVVLLSSGVPVHFAGYAKFGSLCIGLLVLAAGLARLARDGASRAGAAQLVAGLAIALLAHRTGLLAAPAALAGAALAARPRDGRPAPRAAQLALVAAFAGTVAALPWAAGLLQRYDRARHLADAGITPARLRDALDVLGVFAPLAPAGVVAAGFAWPRVPAPARAVAALYALPWFALLATVTGSQGAPRDWDMHAAAGLVAAAGTAAALALAWEHGERARRTIGTAALVAPARRCGCSTGTRAHNSPGWTASSRTGRSGATSPPPAPTTSSARARTGSSGGTRRSCTGRPRRSARRTPATSIRWDSRTRVPGDSRRRRRGSRRRTAGTRRTRTRSSVGRCSRWPATTSPRRPRGSTPRSRGTRGSGTPCG